MVALLAGLGCQVADRAPAARGCARSRSRFRCFLLISGWTAFDRSRYAGRGGLRATVLRVAAARRAPLASDDNILFVLIYLHFVEGRRPDVDLDPAGRGRGRICRRCASIPTAIRSSSPITRTGTCPSWRSCPVGQRRSRSSARGQPASRAVVVAEGALAGEDDPRVPKDYLTQNLIGHFHYMLGVTFERRTGRARARSSQRAARAAPDERRALLQPRPASTARTACSTKRVAAFERSDAINPRYLPSANRVRASDRLAELAAERRP